MNQSSKSDPLAYIRGELQSIKDAGQFRPLRELQGPQGPVATFDGKEVVNLSSNNYLGLANDPRLNEAAIQAIHTHGAGTGSVRTIAGTMDIHMELERRLAIFKKVEAVVVFQSGFTANAGTVAALLGKEDVIVSDRLNHASIIDGARLSRAEIKVYEHSDIDSLRERLAEAKGRRTMVVTDGVFSMDGDVAKLPEVVEAAEEAGAMVMVDDAHASGVMGQNGRGTIDHFGLHGRVTVQVGTLSKAVGVLGGYVAGDKDLIEWLHLRGRPFLFSSSHPPAVVGACLAALDILETEPERIERLWENTRFFKKGLTDLGFNTGASETPITPVMVGETEDAIRFSDRLFAGGVFAQ
ncbi:MAG TPA: aminotransferase class I/II-fold pyridoxal phosphate-dependent enzyme, partial [Armatimonadota bacterium]